MDVRDGAWMPTVVHSDNGRALDSRNPETDGWRRRLQGELRQVEPLLEDVNGAACFLGRDKPGERQLEDHVREAIVRPEFCESCEAKSDARAQTKREKAKRPLPKKRETSASQELAIAAGDAVPAA